ncbi:UNVERIFIED_CONTAM: hypothetical protein PYX00_010764 [Menopon gallinae]|uniref:Low-density lipoprotein receptor-related protein 4 n=1 Tax=Menopon gallinae TaxID=328185 RepID=A0AAW2HH34_9NEOP
MDGSNRKSIVTESVFWPNGLTLDYTVNRIYWADAKHHVIESATFEGADRKKVITKGLPHPFAITLFEDAIYWTDWHTKSIATANKETGMGYKVVHSGLHFPMDIHSFHSQRQPNFTDHCGNDNGGCSHLCLPNRRSYQCVCPLGLQLQRDKRTCFTEPEKLLIFARKKDIRLRSLSEDLSVRNIDMVIPLDDVQSAVALAYDADSNQIYWSDVEGHRISRSYLNGSHQEIVVDTNLASPTGLSVDWVTKKLYWTDSGTNRIEAANLNGTLRTLLIWEALGKPRDIAVDPVAGYLYWSDWGSIPRIEKAGMDGSKRRSIVSSKLQWPNGLAIDRENGKLFWVDGGTKQIEFANLDGSGRKSLQIADTKLLHPFGLAVYEKKIYWSDWETNSIHTADKATGGNSTILRDGVTGLMDVRVFHRDHPVVASMCLIKNGGCSHLCLLAPAPKGYSCACPTGIKLLEDGKTCAPGPFTSLIFAHRVDIRQISLDVPYRVDTVLPLPPMKSARSVDVDAVTGDIYWSDTLEDVIMKASAKGENLESVVTDGLDNADGLAIDSSGRKLYWTDAGRNSIEVSELDGSNRKVLIWSELENPRAITLHYELGLMYWSDWGKRARIEHANMDGTDRRTLISEKLEWPNGLAVDHAAGRLYWNDGKRKIIESSDLQGQNRRMLVKDLPHPYGLVILGNYLYWTDWKTESIHKANKNNGNDSEVVLKGREGLMDIRLVQVKKVKENACGSENGGCSHLCLKRPKGFSCACPTGLSIRNDNKTCNSLPSTYLLFAAKTKLIRISMDTPERWDVGLQIPEVHQAVAIDFHMEKELIFFSDAHLSLIRSVSMTNLTEVRKVVSVNLTMPDGLAVDWLADNIYWTDTGRKMLEVARVDGTCRKAIVTRGLIEPRAIAVYPKRAYLYWTDWGDAPKIERSLLDGSQRKVIVKADLGFPNGLALDYGAKKLYWADALRERIEVSDLHGRFRVQLISKATNPFGLAQYEEHIYWTDWYKKSVERADKTTGRNRTSVRTNLDVTEIRAVSGSKQEGWSPCRVSNGFCTHLCLYRHKDYVCACPDVPDGRKCYKDPTTWVPLRHDEEDDEPSVGAAEEGTKSDLDKIHGDPNTESDDSAGPVADSFSRQLLLITMTVLCVLIIVVAILTFLALLFQRKRNKQKKYLYTEGKNVLTFSNPNYTTSNSNERGGSDKKPFLWKKLKYDRSQDRVFGVQDDKVEDISLIDARQPSVPLTPPENADSLHTKGG